MSGEVFVIIVPIIRITNRRNRNLGLSIIENVLQVCCLAARLRGSFTFMRKIVEIFLIKQNFLNFHRVCSCQFV